MEISEEWFASLTRFETDLIKTYLDIGDPKKSDTMPEIDGPVKIKECVHCKSRKIICYGHSKKGKQRYLCKDCSRTFTMVSKSFFKNTRISYEQRLKLMECEMIASSLKETSYQTRLSVISCFYLRHKLYLHDDRHREDPGRKPDGLQRHGRDRRKHRSDRRDHQNHQTGLQLQSGMIENTSDPSTVRGVFISQCSGWTLFSPSSFSVTTYNAVLLPGSSSIIVFFMTTAASAAQRPRKTHARTITMIPFSFPMPTFLFSGSVRRPLN